MAGALMHRSVKSGPVLPGERFVVEGRWACGTRGISSRCCACGREGVGVNGGGCSSRASQARRRPREGTMRLAVLDGLSPYRSSAGASVGHS